MAKDRVGETNKNKRGTLMEIIKYNSSEDMDVRFLDEFLFIKKGVTYDAFKHQNIFCCNSCAKEHISDLHMTPIDEIKQIIK